MWLLSAFIASWIACWCVGWLMRGWVEAERHRTIPEHPVLRGRPPPNIFSVTTEPPRLRVVQTGPTPYDYEAEGGL